MLGALVTLIIYLLILGLLWWLATYVLDNFPPPEPASRFIRVALVIIFVLVAIYIVLGIFGVGGIGDVPKLRFG